MLNSFYLNVSPSSEQNSVTGKYYYLAFILMVILKDFYRIKVQTLDTNVVTSENLFRKWNV